MKLQDPLLKACLPVTPPAAHDHYQISQTRFSLATRPLRFCKRTTNSYISRSVCASVVQVCWLFPLRCPYVEVLCGIDSWPAPTGRYAEALNLLERFRQQSDLQSVMACIEIYEALLAEATSSIGTEAPAPSFQPDLITVAYQSSTRKYHIIIHLALALRERYSHMGQEPDLDAAIARGQAALGDCGTESVLCPTVLVIHASILEKSYRRTGDRDELQAAESMCRQALGLCATASTLSAAAYHTLGSIMNRLYEVVGTPAYIDEAISLQQRALNSTLIAHDVEDHQCLQALAGCILRRHQRYSDPQDIDDVMSLLAQALKLCPVMHIHRILIVHSMLFAVHSKYHISGRLEDVNNGIDLGRQTMAAPNFPLGERRLGFLTVFANLLSSRYETGLSVDSDLEELVSSRREVLECVLPNFAFRWVCATNLADGLKHRYMRKGEMHDLDESIELYRHAIDLLPEGHHERPQRISSLGKALCQRFHETRNAADLDEAVVLGRSAMAAMSPLHMQYSEISLHTISHLCIRFEVFQAADDLEQAILLSDGLLKTLPDGHTRKDDTRCRLAKSLLLRGIYMSAREDINKAIHSLAPARQRLTESVIAPEVSRTLAASYLIKFRLNRDSHDAGLALDVTTNLLDGVGPKHYERFQCLVHAAELYLERGTPFYDIAAALMHIEEAMLNNCRDVRSKIQGVKDFLDIVKAQYKDIRTTASSTILAQLLGIYISTIHLLPRVAFFGLHLHSRLLSLAMGQTIALDGASHALNISLPLRALEMLEQGRAVFWNHTLRLRSRFDRVPDQFRDRVAYLARQLEKSSDVLRDTLDARTIEKEGIQRRKQSEEFNLLVDQVRCVPGMERFLLHDEYTTLAKAANRGPVVILVSSALACHAIVVKSADEVIGIPLDSITESWLDEHGDVWRTEVIKARSAVRNSRKMIKMAKSSISMSTEAEGILERLWTLVVNPVFSKLNLEVC
jgi:tetratricopeptide (TPR) repeat protein